MQAPISLIPIRNYYRLPNFPKYLNFNETEAFTSETWKTLFDNAVKNHVPYYVIAIAQLPKKSPNEKQRYKIYDAVTLHNYIVEKKGQPFCDLETREPVTLNEIHYLAVQCFKLAPHDVKSVPLERQVFYPLFPRYNAEIDYVKQAYRAHQTDWKNLDLEEQDYHRAQAAALRAIYPTFASIEDKVTAAVNKIHDYLLDSVNYHSENREAVGQIQFIVANQWSKLLDEAQARIWAWCSKMNMQPKVSKSEE